MQADDGLPDAVRHLLRDHIETHEQLEILLLLHAHPFRSWDADAAGAALHVAPELAGDALAALRRVQLALPESPGAPAVRYAPATTKLREAVEQLALAWTEHRLDIVRLMSSNAIDRLRSRTMTIFADRFLFGRRKTGG